MPSHHCSSKPVHHCPADLTLNTPLRALSQFPTNNEQINLTAEEWNILAMVLQHANAGQIVARTGYNAEDVLHLIGRLMVRGLVVLANSPVSSVVQDEPSMPEQKPHNGSTTKFNRAILRRLEQIDQTL